MNIAGFIRITRTLTVSSVLAFIILTLAFNDLIISETIYREFIH